MIVDGFAGGGGASLGIEMALGRSPDVAIDHNAVALAIHAANHPRTRHLAGDIWDARPREVAAGRAVELLWLSPDCRHHSKAKEGKPRDKRVRSLAWVAVRWAREVRPAVILLENVEEFADWGPLLTDGTPCPARRGLTFRRWVGALRGAGYQVEWRELRACDYGAPTTRKRLFVIARSDGAPIVWPSATHGRGLAPYRVAAECIQWEVECPSIFGRARPLAPKTLARIVRGIHRFVLGGATPFVVGHSAPTLIQTGYGERDGQAPRSLDLHQPLGTVVAGGQKHALVASFLAKHYGGHEATGSALTAPMSTVTTVDHHSLVTAPLRVGGDARSVEALLAAYGEAQLPIGGALVHVGGEAHAIVDVGMRMLTPRELFRAQGFPDRYEIDPVLESGQRPTLREQVAACGNSVSPPVAAALVAANVCARRAAA